MSVIVIPTGLLVHSLSFGQRDYSLNFQAGDTGSAQSRVLAPPRWTCSMSCNQSLSQAAAGQWSSMVLQLRGMVNQLEVYDIAAPIPRGTMTGLPVLAANVAVNATTFVITTTPGATLLLGDKLQVGAGQTRQLLQVVAAAVADAAGACTVITEPPLRYAQLAGSAVVTTKPSCLMRRVDTTTQWTSVAAAAGNFNLNLIESWE